MKDLTESHDNFLVFSKCIVFLFASQHFSSYRLGMRISVEIDEATLSEVMTLTKERGKGPALTKAVTEFVRRARAREFGRMIREGAFDYPDPEPGDPANPIPPLGS